MFDWLGKGSSVDHLIAKKSYDKAARVLRQQLKESPNNLRLLQQLAEELAGRRSHQT